MGLRSLGIELPRHAELETGLWAPHSTAFTGTPSDTRTRIDELQTLKKSACDSELKLGFTNNAADTLTLKQI